MVWKCPACQESIHHAAHEEQPRPGALYRCHICRMELVFDQVRGKLTVAPMSDDQPRPKRT